MDSLIVDSMTRPTIPHHHSQTGGSPEVQTLDQKKKSSTISRTESYRRARGTEDDKPKVEDVGEDEDEDKADKDKKKKKTIKVIKIVLIIHLYARMQTLISRQHL